MRKPESSIVSRSHKIIDLGGVGVVEQDGGGITRRYIFNEQKFLEFLDNEQTEGWIMVSFLKDCVPNHPEIPKKILLRRAISPDLLR